MDQILEAPLMLPCKVERGKKKSSQTVIFDPSGYVKFEDDEVTFKDISSLALEKFGGGLAITVSKKEVIRLSVDKSASEMLMDVAEHLDLWCQEFGSPSYKPLKGRALKRRSRADLLTRRKSSGGAGIGSSSTTLSRSGTSPLKQSLPSIEEVDDTVLPENLENMKTGFLQYRRMQLKGQAAGDAGKGGGLPQELADVERLEKEVAQVKSELEKKRTELSEKQKQYFNDGQALAAAFLEVAKHVTALGKGPLSQVFQELQQEYAKAVGLDEDSSESSGEGGAPPGGSVRLKNSMNSPKLQRLAGLKPNMRLERSDSTIGWVRAKPVPAAAAFADAPGSEAGANGASSGTSDQATERFRAIVGTLEAALYLDRPMEGVLDAAKEKGRRLQAEIDEMRAQIASAHLILVQEEDLMKEVQANLAASKSLAGTLATVSAAPKELQDWILVSSAPPAMEEHVKQLTEANLYRQQTYLEIITEDYSPDRAALELAEDGSLFGCRADTLFELLICGEGAKRYVEFENAFMYGFRAWVTPVSLLQRFIEAFCTTPSAYRSKERIHIHMARLRVLRLLSTWIDLHEYDISEKRFSSLIHSFLDTVSIAGYDEESRKLRGKMSGNLFYDEDDFDKPYPAPVLPSNLKSFTSFLELDPLEVARQITLQDAAIYQGMQTRELLDCQWTKQGGTKAPTVLVITKRFNEMAAWVVGLILREEDMSRRAKVIENIIKTAEHLLELQNFNGVMQLIASLSKTEVVRLQRTHGALSKDSRKAFESLRKLLDKNCARLRDLYKEAQPPCLPYIGTFMTDLTFIGEMKPRLPNGMINYRKLQLQAASLESLLGRRGQILYRLKEVKEIRDFICKKGVAFETEEDAYNQSLKLEPRDSGRR